MHQPSSHHHHFAKAVKDRQKQFVLHQQRNDLDVQISRLTMKADGNGAD